MQTNGPAIRAIREAQGWNQSKLAAAVGISGAYLNNIEAGRRSGSPEVTKKIAENLRVPLAAVLAAPRADVA